MTVRHREKVRADVTQRTVVVTSGEPAVVTIEVTNLDNVIRSFEVSMLGIDPEHVVFDPPVLVLFPEDRETVTATVTLPPDHPSGPRSLTVEVVEPRENAPAPAVAEFVIDLIGQPGLSVAAEPATLEVGSQGTFLLHLTNTGNTVLDVDVVAQDPERLVDVSFEPERPRLQPGEKTIVQADATGPRPWFGSPAVRVLEVTATAGDTVAFSSMAMLQRPRIGRRLIALLGLLLVVTLFAWVIAESFARVAELTAQNEALVSQGLGFDDQATGRAVPASIGGMVASTTGAGIDGAAVALYESDNLVQPEATTVTDETGGFRFASVADGTYLVRVEAAGFGQLWYPGVPGVDEAEPVEIVDGAPVSDLAFALAGRPGSIAGVVLGVDVAGALVEVRLPEGAIAGSELSPVAAVVQAVALDATGAFVLPNLATPATYEVVVSKEGFATEVLTVTLGAGDQRQELEILLQRGIGLIGGSVVDTTGAAVGGVDITATDGVSTVTTRSLSGAGAGTFQLRDLTTPGTYTLTFTRPGFFTETRTLALEAEQQRSDLVVVMTRDVGSLGGTVVSGDGTGLGGITVTVIGAELERATRTLSVGEVGTWFIDALPVPGTYTVTFSGDGWTTTAVSVELLPGPEAQRTGVDATLVASTASVLGRVTNSSGDPIGGVAITLEGSGIERRTVSSDEPVGAYAFDGLPPGAYTLTYRRPGSTPETLLVDLDAGERLELDDVQLEARARITGVVRRNGVETAGIGVVVYREATYPAEIVAQATTGSGGAFEIIGLEAPETYVLEFEVPAGGQVEGSETVFLRPDEVVELSVDL